MAVARDPERARTYIETSAILSVLFGQETKLASGAVPVGHGFTSSLTVVEARRAITRGNALGTLTADERRRATIVLEEFFSECDIVPMSDEILLRAGRGFPIEPVRTLDAIHLATMDSVGLPSNLIHVITRDRRVRENALAMGYNCGE
ncbi:MAG: PIN domain-containing protein [Gemmatimonadaceae bacterium]